MTCLKCGKGRTVRPDWWCEPCLSSVPIDDEMAVPEVPAVALLLIALIYYLA